MKLPTFKGGIHPNENKQSTESSPIEEIAAPEKVYVSLLQNIGTTLEAVVKAGDFVKMGDKIGDSKAFLSVPVHAPVSGKIIAIESCVYPGSGFESAVVIENDNKYETNFYQPIEEYKSKTREELLSVIRERGVVGMGGAAFPTHVKLSPPQDKKIDTLIINGAECEPYLSGDNRVMAEKSGEVIEGIKIAMHILGVDKCIIGIEANKAEAIVAIKKGAENDSRIEIKALEVKYPQGGEKQLIKALLNRVVPVKKLPAEIGVVVINVQTALAIYEGVIKGKPLIDRVITVGGRGIGIPKNLKVKIGTSFEYILNMTKFNPVTTKKLIMGGPMMGIAQFTAKAPVIKGTSGITALTEEEIRHYKPRNCITCSKCIEVCPMNLMPIMYGRMATVNKWDELDRYKVTECIECGACSYICPSARPLNEAIKIGKSKIKNRKNSGG